ncbi:MAG: hypothetical protein JSR59_05780 [Proteobacteria bacterium]|nr:hypothetical protein [Pseudomonadota bacterium]
MRSACRPLVRLAMALAAALPLLSGCAVVSAGASAVGAAASVAGSVVSTTVTVTGKVVGKAVDAVTPSSDQH